MFEGVLAVTIAVYDLPATESAYRDHFGYEVEERSAVTDAMAERWATPAMRGRPYLTMRPVSGADFRLRFIESETVAGYAPLCTAGWSATELLVQDPDDMAQRLAKSPFTIIGVPRDLSSDGHVRAMQVQGPSGEVIYLTRITGARTRLYGCAQSMVDRAFILVVGSNSCDELADFYGGRFGHKLQTFGKTPISVVANALGVPPQETLFDMKLARLGNQYSIEMDGYPMPLPKRPRGDGELPPGMAMVTFAVHSLRETGLEWRAAPAGISASFYNGANTAVTTGVAGEWLELVESPSPQ